MLFCFSLLPASCSHWVNCTDQSWSTMMITSVISTLPLNPSRNVSKFLLLFFVCFFLVLGPTFPFTFFFSFYAFYLSLSFLIFMWFKRICSCSLMCFLGWLLWNICQAIATSNSAQCWCHLVISSHRGYDFSGCDGIFPIVLAMFTGVSGAYLKISLWKGATLFRFPMRIRAAFLRLHLVPKKMNLSKPWWY